MLRLSHSVYVVLDGADLLVGPRDGGIRLYQDRTTHTVLIYVPEVNMIPVSAIVGFGPETVGHISAGGYGVLTAGGFSPAWCSIEGHANIY